jgi:hypothetical protein
VRQRPGWVEFRRKQPVMVAMDLARFAALLRVPVAFALGWLSFGQLLVVSVITAAADIAFKAASGELFDGWRYILTTPLLLPRHDHVP